MGRTRIRLADMLIKHGYRIEPERLMPNNGYNNKFWDCCSWNGYAKRIGDEMSVNVCSWEPMGRLVKRGFSVQIEDSDAVLYSLPASPKNRQSPNPTP